MRANQRECETMKQLLNKYEEASGQAINMSKSEIFFSSNVDPVRRGSLSQMLGVMENMGSGKYLGLPSVVGRKKKAVFNFIEDKIWRKINSWGGKVLSKAGREVLIKSVVQSIPSYCMSIYLLPPSLCDEIEKMMNSFW